MAYQIAYNPEDKKKYPIADHRKQNKKWMVWSCCTLLLIGMLAIPEIWGRVKHILLPGDAEQTAAAITSLVENVREGTPVGDAVTVFCREILKNAQTATSAD